MAEKILLHLLILCGILCGGIIATSSKDDIQDSSALLAREKRVINHEPDGHQPASIQIFNYMTTIKEFNRVKCAGTILSHYKVITAANCIEHSYGNYVIFSGSGYTQNSATHNVTSVVKHFGNVPINPDFDGIALLTPNPPFTFGRRTGSIKLYSGHLTPSTQVTISGWGCYYPLIPAPPGTQRRLRQITIPIINHEACLNAYRRFNSITYKHICTYHTQKYCAHTDGGAPLVINNKLAGIFVYKGEFSGQINPEVFVNLQLPEYSEWIHQNSLS